MSKYIILCVSFLVTGSIAGVAPFIKPCAITDSECIVNSARIALPHMVPGIPELGLPSLDPLAIKNINMDSGGLKLSLTDVVVHELSKCKFNKIERDQATSSGVIDLVCPIKAVGNYKAGGKLFVVDVEGEGPFLFEGEQMHVTVNFKLKKITKDGKDYYKISSFDYDYEPLTKFIFKFENLFNGDKAKAAPIEDILDKTWKEVILHPEVGKPVIKEVFVEAVEIVSQLFQAIPVDEVEIA